MTVSFSSTLSRTTPLSLQKEGRLLERIATSVLGRSYDLSVVFVGDARSRTLNRTYRRKDKPTNVLSFPLSKNSGELYLDLPLCMREAPLFDATPHRHVYFLFVHGLLHLKGLDHGARMERLEREVMKKFYRETGR
ncbi:MAG: hypothetical protein AMXMBFR44_2860 [Candidatus Campbellbacteria bacterium]